MTEISKSAPIMITGATGYVAGWIVKKLLDEGYTVHAPIRSPERSGKTYFLDQLAENSIGKIKYFNADLLKEGSYDEAMKGCELVFHTASPFNTGAKDAQKQLVDPALKGTRNILNSANKSASVKRVVLTSSIAAMYGDAKDIQSYTDKMITEKNWNETSTLNHQPYSYSKKVAEREAWKIAGEQSKWDLVVINPGLVIGPGISPDISSDSYKYIKQLGDGTMKAGTADAEIGIVDVRDVAEAHYNAGFNPNASGRHIIMADTSSFLDLANKLKNHYGDKYPFPTKTIPKAILWMIAPLAGFTRKFVSRNIGYPFKADNSKSISELNMSYRPVQESIVDFFQQMIDNSKL